MPKTIIVTGCEDHYVPLVKGLIDSIEGPARANQFDIGLLDFGLSDEHRSKIEGRGISVITPEWDFDPALFITRPGNHFKAMTSRPHLRKYFPGYDYYVWMDADTWVQDWSGIGLYLSSAETLSFAVTPEVDRSYSPVYGNFSVISWRRNCFVRCFDVRVADQLALFPMINCGVFAARADAPHWDLWSRMLGEIFLAKREPFFFADQISLNAVVRQQGINTAFLPSICNWMCNRAMPIARKTRLNCTSQIHPFSGSVLSISLPIQRMGFGDWQTDTGRYVFVRSGLAAMTRRGSVRTSLCLTFESTSIR